jgi:hypothetical protein
MLNGFSADGSTVESHATVAASSKATRAYSAASAARSN